MVQKVVKKKKKSQWDMEVEKLHKGVEEEIQKLPSAIEGEETFSFLEKYVVVKKKVDAYSIVISQMKKPHNEALAKIRQDEALTVGTMEKLLDHLKSLLIQRREIEAKEQKEKREQELLEWEKKGGDALSIPVIREDLPSSFRVQGHTLYFMDHKEFIVKGAKEKREKIYRNDERVKDIPDECFALDYVRLGAKITAGERYSSVLVKEGETIGVRGGEKE